MIRNPNPPKLILNFFRWYCHPKLVDHIEGDLLEVYGERLKAFAASMGAVVITLLTVSYQAIKAAMMNPVKSLRSE